MELNESTFPQELQPLSECHVRAIEPLNHTLIVLLVMNPVTRKTAILLARIYTSKTWTPDVASSRIEAELDETSRNPNGRAATLNYELSYSIVHNRIEAASLDALDDKLATHDTLDSIIHQTAKRFKFYDVVDDTLVPRHEIKQEDIAYHKGNYANNFLVSHRRSLHLDEYTSFCNSKT